MEAIAVVVIVLLEDIVLRGLTIRKRVNLEPFFIGNIPSITSHVHFGNEFHANVFLTVYRALDAVNMTWDNPHLKNILMSDQYCTHVPETAHATFNNVGHPLWNGNCFSFFLTRISFLRWECHQNAGMEDFLS